MKFAGRMNSFILKGDHDLYGTIAKYSSGVIRQREFSRPKISAVCAASPDSSKRASS